MRRYLTTLLFLLANLLAGTAMAQLGGTANTGLGLSTVTRDGPIPLEQAFPYYVSAISPERLSVTWDIAPGHYLYRHAFHFSLQLRPGADSEPAVFSLPEGLHKTDQFFGDIEAYYTQARAEIALPAADLTNAVLIIQYQGCADWGFCYPPQRQEFKLLGNP